MGDVRLIVITVPPPALLVELTAFRTICSWVSSSRAALEYPPHVTLRTGLCLPEAALEPVLSDLGRLLDAVPPFPVRTGDIVFRTIARDGAQVPIVALELEASAPLRELNARLLSYEPYRASDRTEFWPHLTLAFADLAPDGQTRLERYLAARDELRSRRFTWSLDNVSLYRRFDRCWHPCRVLRLG